MDSQTDRVCLRDALLNSLKSLPGKRQFHIHTLVSSPRKNNDLFPFAKPKVRTHLQDILVLLSEAPQGEEERVLVTAIEASLYTIPSTSCALLYISKVDSTGQGAPPSPTSTVVQSFLRFHLIHPPPSVKHLWIHVFARSQAQYLFPNSADWEGKKVLSDRKLCAWWKKILGEVSSSIPNEHKKEMLLHFNLPGYNEAEALQSLHFALPPSTSNPNSNAPKWIYGHSYSQTIIPLPCPPDQHNLGSFIPKFDDDPKGRFIDDLAYNTNNPDHQVADSPPRKRQRIGSRPPDSSASVRPPISSVSVRPPNSSAEEGGSIVAKPISKAVVPESQHAPGELSRVTPDEFWERMSFRQECVSGALTGFFTLGVSFSSSLLSSSVTSTLAPETGHVSSQINKRILTTLTTGVEFSTRERTLRATEVVEKSLKGLCEGIPPPPPPPSALISTSAIPHQGAPTDEPTKPEEGKLKVEVKEPKTPPRKNLSLPPTNLLRPPDTSTPFPEPDVSLEVYHKWIYGFIEVSNPDLEKKTKDGEGAVTVLAVRKKKKVKA